MATIPDEEYTLKGHLHRELQKETAQFDRLKQLVLQHNNWNSVIRKNVDCILNFHSLKI